MAFPRLTDEEAGLVPPAPSPKPEQGNNGKNKKKNDGKPQQPQSSPANVTIDAIIASEAKLIDPMKSILQGDLVFDPADDWECPFLPELTRGDWQSPSVFERFLKAAPGLTSGDPASTVFIRDLYRAAEHKNAKDPDKPISTLPGQTEKELVLSLQEGLRALNKLCASKWLDDRDIGFLIDFAGQGAAGNKLRGRFWWPRSAGQGWSGASNNYLRLSVLNPMSSWAGRRVPDQKEYNRFLEADYVLLGSHHLTHWVSIIIDNKKGLMYHADSGWHFAGASDRLIRDFRALLGFYRMNKHPSYDKLAHSRPVVLFIPQQRDHNSCGLAVAELFRSVIREGQTIGHIPTVGNEDYYMRLRKEWIKHLANYCGVTFKLGDEFLGGPDGLEPDRLEQYKNLVSGLRADEDDFDPNWGLAERRPDAIRHEDQFIWGLGCYWTVNEAKRHNLRNIKGDRQVRIPPENNDPPLVISDDDEPGETSEIRPSVREAPVAGIREGQNAKLAVANKDRGQSSRPAPGYKPESFSALRGEGWDQPMEDGSDDEPLAAKLKRPDIKGKGKAPITAKPAPPAFVTPDGNESSHDSEASNQRTSTPTRTLFQGKKLISHNAFQLVKLAIKPSNKWKKLDRATLLGNIGNPYELIRENDEGKGNNEQILLSRPKEWKGWFEATVRLSAEDAELVSPTPIQKRPAGKNTLTQGEGMNKASPLSAVASVEDGFSPDQNSNKRKRGGSKLTPIQQRMADKEAELEEQKKKTASAEQALKTALEAKQKEPAQPGTSVAPPHFPHFPPPHQSGYGHHHSQAHHAPWTYPPSAPPRHYPPYPPQHPHPPQ